jgi:multidrug efflux pump subunit AcrA (membrane-fusion protein)
MIRKHWSRIAGIILVIGLAVTGCAGQETASTPENNPVAAALFANVVTASGEVVPLQWAMLSFETGGRLEWLIMEGSQVAAGEALARLDTTDLDQAVAQAQAALVTAQAQLTAAKAGATPEEIAAAEAAVVAAQGGVAAAKAAVAQAEANAQIARANLKQVEGAEDAAEAALTQGPGHTRRGRGRPGQGAGRVIAPASGCDVGRDRHLPGQGGPGRVGAVVPDQCAQTIH